jgi:hypothetical protein
LCTITICSSLRMLGGGARLLYCIRQVVQHFSTAVTLAWFSTENRLLQCTICSTAHLMTQHYGWRRFACMCSLACGGAGSSVLLLACQAWHAFDRGSVTLYSGLLLEYTVGCAGGMDAFTKNVYCLQHLCSLQCGIANTLFEGQPGQRGCLAGFQEYVFLDALYTERQVGRPGEWVTRSNHITVIW